MKIFYVAIILFLVGCQNQQKNITKSNLKTIDKYQNIKENRYNVAFLIMDGTYNTEFTAPFDIFQHTIFRENIKAMNVFSVANTDKPITTFEGMRILPDFNYLKD